MSILATTGIHALPAGTVWHVAPELLPNIASDRQFRVISEAARAAQAGDTVVIHSGVYRESVSIEKSGTAEKPIRFEAAPFAKVTISGADRVLDWRKESGNSDNIFSAECPAEFLAWSSQPAYPDDDYHRLIGRREQVHVDGETLQQVLQREQLSRGTFYIDPAAKRLFIWARNNVKPGSNETWSPDVEVSTRAVLWKCSGAYVQTHGLRFCYAANRAQETATVFGGRNDVLEECIFERMNAGGAVFGAPDQIVRRCIFQDNGQLGFAAIYAHNLQMSGCLVRNNNAKNFNRQWEAGGDKIVLSRGVVLEKCRFLDNHGSGVWFDIGNENCTVRNCFIADNEDAGLFYEISSGLHAHDNVIVGNGLEADAAAWGSSAGIAISSSPGCVIERNLLVGNKEGFNFREQVRTTAHIGAPPGAAEIPTWNHDEIVRHNLIAYNRDAQTWGWFTTSDERNWPAKTQKEYYAGVVSLPTPDPNSPRDLSLEKLKLSLYENVYAVAEGEGLFRWGAPWKHHEYFDESDGLRRVQGRLNLEQRSVLAPIIFADLSARDFRILANSPARKLQAYPRGEVPGTRLGIVRKMQPAD
jgi:Right handed beta helix region